MCCMVMEVENTFIINDLRLVVFVLSLLRVGSSSDYFVGTGVISYKTRGFVRNGWIRAYKALELF